MTGGSCVHPRSLSSPILTYPSRVLFLIVFWRTLTWNTRGGGHGRGRGSTHGANSPSRRRPCQLGISSPASCSPSSSSAGAVPAAGPEAASGKVRATSAATPATVNHHPAEDTVAACGCCCWGGPSPADEWATKQGGPLQCVEAAASSSTCRGTWKWKRRRRRRRRRRERSAGPVLSLNVDPRRLP